LVQPAPYSPSDAPEVEAIDTFKSLIDHKRIKADIKERDKYPNIDGYIEIVTESGYPIGKLEVQIKKLPERNLEKPRYSCHRTLFSYVAEVATYSCIFIGVNVRDKKCYWFNINQEYIDTLKFENGQFTKDIIFELNNIIDGTHVDYINKWTEIAKINKSKLIDYDKQKKLILHLSKYTNRAIGISDVKFKEIHNFLDIYNNLLENEFELVRNTFYPELWKLGIAYHTYLETELSYAIYPINVNKNDVQIKELNRDEFLELRDGDLGISVYYKENPIKVDPNKFARNLVKKKIDTILEYKLLTIDSSYLINEFMISFVDHFHEQLGIILSDKYSLEEIEKGFFRYLPLWLDEAIKFMLRTKRNGATSIERLLYRKPYFNPDMLIFQIMKNEREEIRKKVIDRLAKNESISIAIGNEKYPMKLFHDFFIRLKLIGVKEIYRIYRKKDHGRITTKGGLIWNLLSEEDLRYNLNIFFDNYINVYSEILRKNFPKLYDEIYRYKGVAGILVIYKSSDKYDDIKDKPTMRYYYLYNKEQKGIQIFIYKENEIKEFQDKITQEISININSIEYHAIWAGAQNLDFIYDDLPMFSYIYEIIKSDLNEY
jgi:hypothetical protein